MVNLYPFGAALIFAHETAFDMQYILGLDTSTTASKALLVDARGNVVGSASTPHDHSIPQPRWSEQNPLDWWRAIQESIRQVLRASGIDPASVKSIGLTGQMHGLVLLGDDGRALRPAMLWNDGRSQRQCDAIRTRLGLRRLVSVTGNDAFAGFSAPKLLWVRDHEPAVYAKVAQVLLPKDYIRYRLIGTFATDKAGAGGTLLLDLAARDWSREVLQALEIPFRWLPKTFEGPEMTGAVSAEGAEATGLNAGTPVVAGAGDQAAQAVGVGAVTPGIWALTLGTSGVVFAPCAQPHVDVDGRAHAFPHAVPGRWHMMGVMLSAAGSLAWYHDTLCANIDYDTLIGEAEEVPPGSDGLVFLPYLTGERTPYADPLATGAFVGLTPRHTRGHMTRAVLEGVAFGLRDNLLLLQEAGLAPPDELRISGGGARSPLWRQILADILQVELKAVHVTEGAALGAALLAGVGAGFWAFTEAACEEVVGTQSATQPGPNCPAYADLHERFASLYGLLKPFYHA